VDDETLQSWQARTGSVDGPALAKRVSAIDERGGGNRSAWIVVGLSAWGG